MAPEDINDGPDTDDLDQELARLLKSRDDLARRILSKAAASTPGLATPLSTAQSEGAFESAITDEEIMQAMRVAKASRTERIKLLTRYNDIKDVAQGLMGMIAEQRRCRVIEVMEELGVDKDD